MPGHPTSPRERSRPGLPALRLPGRRGAALLAAGLIVGCASAQTVATDLDLAAVVGGDEAESPLTRAGQDDLSLRADGSTDGGAAGGIGTVVAAPPGSSTTTAANAPAAPTAAPPTVGAAGPDTTVVTTAEPPASGPVTDGAVTGSTLSPGGSSSTVPVTTVQAPVAAPSTPSPTSTTAPPPATDSPEGLAQGEARSEVLLGELRTSVAAPPLTRDAELDAVAREWSRHMAETGVFEHSASPYGENIAFTSNVRLTASEAAEVFHRLWTESEVHYNNMTGSYVKVGIGLYRTERGWYGTHVFGY